MTICDFSCSGPSLLKAAKRKFPNAKLYAYNDKGIGLKLRRILEKELGNNVNIIEEMKDDIKFDHIIMNPPYDKNLHLKILREAMKYSDDIVNLSPIRWLQDPLAEYKKNSDFKNFEDIRKRIETLDVLTAKESQNLFGNVMNMDLGIYKITDKGGFDSRSLINPICLKLKNNTFGHFDYNMKDGWRVRISTISGGKSGGSGNRNFTLYSQKLLAFYDGKKDNKWWHEYYNKNQYSKTTEEITTSLKFNSEEECNNFIDVMTKTKLGRYYYHIMSIDVHVYAHSFIKLDYTHAWTDEDLYKYFDLTQEEIREIETLI